MTDLLIPAPVRAFLIALKTTHSSIEYTIEKGGDVAGNWWVDIAGPLHLTVEYRPFGPPIDPFALYWGEGVYGEGADETCESPLIAAQRVGELIDHPPLSP